ncbi:Cro/C1-type HTH DNA-binding domain-containing protein [Mesobacillus persicus]|uniref:Cro/C1-type HTH DNA-binding domain-containing protein n=1 Tax=Mesobacillus persicus TaxID=930146 RepID=A0A1H8K8I9_9BACI|nr:helix-turn-helix transcriptional regulator [Mesobacillus persicus]SEN89283.1 Cro/C1-type HTH DNA-binding domain-containing protein [Mesobacillus persicus]
MGKDVQVFIYELMESRGISSIRELGRLTDIRHAALIELANQKRQNINFTHIKKLAETLNISDMNEIMRIIDTKDK